MVYSSTVIDMTRTGESDTIRIKEFGRMAIHSIGTGTGHGDIQVSNNGTDWKNDGASMSNLDFVSLIILDNFPWEFIRFVPKGTGTGTLTMLISIKQ